MADRSLEVQKAVVATLKGDAGVSSIVGARVYDRVPQDVAFPHIQIGDMQRLDFDGVNLRGMEAVLQVHAWSRAIGRVECRNMLTACRAALHRVDLSLDAGTLVLCRWSGSRDLLDPDGVTAHGIADFTIITDG